nr:hypothetical protein [Tanacetum cinerariifolium]
MLAASVSHPESRLLMMWHTIGDGQPRPDTIESVSGDFILAALCCLLVKRVARYESRKH